MPSAFTTYNAANDINAGLLNGGLKINSNPNNQVRTYSVPKAAPIKTSPNYSPPAVQQQPVQEVPQEDPYASLRADISSSWDNYLNSLQGTSGYLNDQQTAQQGIADTQLQQGINTANESKANSLRDIASTTRNAFQAGNNYLGSLGAGDSSAANQYSFAINKQAQKQTGDLNNFVSGQIKDLQSQHDTQIQQIAQWFAQQQEALKQQIAQGGLQKSQDLQNLSKSILDQAIQATNALKANTQNQYNALVQWAAGNSSNLGQLQSNIAGVNSQFAPGQVNLIGQPQMITRYGGTTGTKTDIFGNPI